MLPQLRSLTLSSGATFNIENGVTIVAGPNNSGKSLLLQEIVWLFGRGPNTATPETRVLHDATLEWPSDEESLVQWLDSRYGWRPPGQYSDGHWGDRTVTIPQIGTLLEGNVRTIRSGSVGAGQLASISLLHLDTQSRLQHNFGPQPIDPRKSVPQSPAQRLFADRDLESRVSTELERAFSVGLVIDRYAVTDIPLLMGKVYSQETAQPQSIEYLDELAALPHLSSQGDGYRAFSNILIQIATSDFPLVLVDEPEAFLHPPQARLLGRMLAEKVTEGRQVIVATHSTDIVEGLTSVRTPASSVAVLRLTRGSQVTNRVAQVKPEDVRALYDDSLLRYARILGGLFSDGTVVCEGDSDCTYYEAVADHLADSTGVSSSTGGATSSGISYVHTSGKARIARAVTALKAAKVPAVSIVDFDIMRSTDEFRKLFEAHGGNFDAIRPLRNQVASDIESNTSSVSRVAVQAEITSLLGQNSDASVSNTEIEKLRGLLVGGDSGWRAAKRSGRAYLSGSAAAAFDSIVVQCEAVGCFIVPVGELEMFHREVPSGDKPSWLRKVLEEGIYKSATESHRFIEKVLDYIISQQ